MSALNQLEPAFGTDRLLSCKGNASYDASVFQNQSARFFPKGNRCEQRAFVGQPSWYGQAQATNAAGFAQYGDHTPFVFFDCDTKIARQEAQAKGKIFRGLAININAYLRLAAPERRLASSQPGN